MKDRKEATVVSPIREAQAKMTRDRIVEAAFQAFSVKGYQATSATEIASAAGASRATFYLHFATKAEIIVDVIDRNQPELFQRYTLFARESCGTQEDICMWLMGIIGRWKDEGLHYQAMEQAVATEPKVAQRWIDSITEAAALFTRELSPASNAQHFKDNHLAILALMIQFERVMFFAVVGQLLDVETFCRVLAAQWWAVLTRIRG
ncbi:TetR/AcrR family transcriptional regulator [Pseudomonas sp. IT-P218]|uniref:TetR/AcrR family transcriptional regulator n=1 Tax=Pseudomonas sp. IT-P218 TaxID=3026449 RepID=UPI0039E1D4A6